MSTYFATICGVRHHPPKGFSRLIEYTLELSCGHYLKAVSNVARGADRMPALLQSRGSERAGRSISDASGLTAFR